MSAEGRPQGPKKKASTATSVERLPATASGLGVGITDLKTLSRQTIVKMDFATRQVIEAVSVNSVPNTREITYAISRFRLVN
jgi:hypothetical protein